MKTSTKVAPHVNNRLYGILPYSWFFRGSHCQAPDGLCFQLWYFDDGILVGTPSALSSFLDVLQHQGPSYGLHPNLSKCEVFWPSGDQPFVDFPPAVKRVVLPKVGYIDFLGSPI